MATRVTGAVVLGCLLVVAGCGGLLPAGSVATTDTVTPAVVPSDSPTPTPGAGQVPGVTPAGVVDPAALGSAHRAVLANHSYTRRTDRTGRYPNGSLRFRTGSVLRVAPTPDGSRFRTVTTFGGPHAPPGLTLRNVSRVDLYGGEGGYVQFTYENGTRSYDVFPRVGVRGRTLRLLFAGFETRVAGRGTCNGVRCHRIVSTSVSSGPLLADALVTDPDATVTDGSLTAVVDARGLVRRYRISYVVDAPGGEYSVTRTVVYEGLDETTVRRPAWVENATGGATGS